MQPDCSIPTAATIRRLPPLTPPATCSTKALTPKKSRSCEATTATTTQEAAFCHGRLMVQSITSDNVRCPLGWPPFLLLPAAPPAPPPLAWKPSCGTLLLLLATAGRRGCLLRRAAAACQQRCGLEAAAGQLKGLAGSAAACPHRREAAACCLTIVWGPRTSAASAAIARKSSERTSCSTDSHHPAARAQNMRDQYGQQMDKSKGRTHRRGTHDAKFEWNQERTRRRPPCALLHSN